MSLRASRCAGSGVDCEVAESEAARDSRPQRGGLEEQPVSGLAKGLTGVAGGVGGVPEGVHRFVLVSQEFEADGGLVVLSSGSGA